MGSQRANDLEIVTQGWMRKLVTSGLEPMRLGGGRAVVRRLRGCHAEEGADGGCQGLQEAGWRILGGRFPAAS